MAEQETDPLYTEMDETVATAFDTPDADASGDALIDGLISPNDELDATVEALFAEQVHEEPNDVLPPGAGHDSTVEGVFDRAVEPLPEDIANMHGEDEAEPLNEEEQEEFWDGLQSPNPTVLDAPLTDEMKAIIPQKFWRATQRETLQAQQQSYTNLERVVSLPPDQRQSALERTGLIQAPVAAPLLPNDEEFEDDDLDLPPMPGQFSGPLTPQEWRRIHTMYTQILTSQLKAGADPKQAEDYALETARANDQQSRQLQRQAQRDLQARQQQRIQQQAEVLGDSVYSASVGTALNGLPAHLRMGASALTNRVKAMFPAVSFLQMPAHQQVQVTEQVANIMLGEIIRSRPVPTQRTARQVGAVQSTPSPSAAPMNPQKRQLIASYQMMGMDEDLATQTAENFIKSKARR